MTICFTAFQPLYRWSSPSHVILNIYIYNISHKYGIGLSDIECHLMSLSMFMFLCLIHFKGKNCISFEGGLAKHGRAICIDKITMTACFACRISPVTS